MSLICRDSQSYTHTHTLISLRHTQAQKAPHIHRLTHSCTHIHAFSHILTHILKTHIHGHALSFSYTYPQTHIHRITHSSIHTKAHFHTHMHSHALTLTFTCPHTYTPSHTHVQTPHRYKHVFTGDVHTSPSEACTHACTAS